MASKAREKARGENARKPYQLLLSEEERARYEAAAAADSRPLAQWIRLSLDRASKRTK